LKLEDGVRELLARLGNDLRIATPLGLGKPNALLNLLYARAKADPGLKLTLSTALSLNPPSPREDLARRFFLPFRDRQWGRDYPVLEYARDAEAGKLPSNVRVHEFYFQAGVALHSPAMQRDYQSVNYTHVARNVFEEGVQAIVQLVARDGRRISLSCNPDLTLDVTDLCRGSGRPFVLVGVVHPELPFLEGEAAVEEGYFDLLIDDPEAVKHELFALPRLPVDDTDHAIGFHASRLIEDGGTLQIGIGALSDALVSALILRHREPAVYAEAMGGGATLGPFREGLYGLSEMVMDGFMHLRRAGVLRREVVDEASGAHTFLHGAFYLGSKEFYRWLGELSPPERAGLRMTRVSKVNDLYDPNEIGLRLQRKRARFVNTCMQATLLGGAASETLEDGRVVSGVGGQYNFVAMAHELPDARSVILLRSTRESRGKRSSNVVWSHGQLTIPRHLRDVFVTEYGVADVRGKSDEDCIRAMIEVADAEFQDELVDQAKSYGKLGPAYRVPDSARANTPARIAEWADGLRRKGQCRPFPFGSDFTPEEERLALALPYLKAAGERSKWELLRLMKDGGSAPGTERALARMGLATPVGIKSRIYRRLVAGALGAIESKFNGEKGE